MTTTCGGRLVQAFPQSTQYDRCTRCGIVTPASSRNATCERVALCGMHNCEEPIQFIQADGEAHGVGRWTHVDANLNPSPVTGYGHVARPY